MGTIAGEYNPILVLLSFAIAVFGSYTALRVARHIPRGRESTDRAFWIAIAAFALGGGAIWSMHFVGMVALDLGIPVSYDVALTLASLALAVAITSLGFWVVSREVAGPLTTLAAGSFMGVGIAGMHYTGMAAMRMPATLSYDPALVSVSIAIAIAASMVALRLAMRPGGAWLTVVGAWVMGAAVSGMHYTGMAAAIFRYDEQAVGRYMGALSPGLLAFSVLLVSMLTLTIAFSIADRSPRSVARRLRDRRWLKPLAVGLLLAGVVAAPIGAGWWVNSTLERTLRERLEEELQTVLSADVTALRIWLEKQVAAAEVAASEPRVRDLVGEVLEQDGRLALDSAPGRSGALADLRDYLMPLSRANDYADVAVIDRSYRLIDGGGVELGGADTGELGRVIARTLAGESVISKPFLPETSIQAGNDPSGLTRPMMLVAAPVRDEDGAIIGGIAFQIRPEQEFGRILGVARSGESGETYAFDERGLMISESRFDEALRAIGLIPDVPGSQAMLRLFIRDPGGDMLRGFRPMTPRSEQPLTRMAADAIEGNSGVDVDGYRDYRGVPVVGAWTWLPEFGFGVATELDVAEAYARLDRVRQAFWALLGLLATVVVGLLIAYHIVGRMHRRMKRAQKLGRYTLEKKIGQGGMGAVYVARHAMLRRPTAVKLLRSQESQRQGIARFEREVQLTSQLTHPNTIAIYDYGRTPEGIFYYAMEYLPGYTLQLLVKEHGAQPEGRVIHILDQVCGSLAEAHSAGLIHRDIKPSNVILCERGGVYDVVKVLDFGLVKEVDGSKDLELTAAGTVAGTPNYLSPEGIRAPDQVDARGDIYCLGAVGYYLLTGRHVFEADSAIEVLSQHLNTAPERPSTRLGRAISADLEELVLQCLEKDRDRRPPSAAALRQALRSCGDGASWDEDTARAWWTTGPGAGRTRVRDEASSDDGKSAQTVAVALEGRLSTDT